VADVFISYSKLERRLTEELADDLEAVGLTVWWDISILPGDRFMDVILKELGEAKAAVVIWTRSSVKSDWVYSEASRARKQGKLISVKQAELDMDDIPPPFDAVHTDLIDSRDAIFSALEKLGLNIDKDAVQNVSPLDLQEQEAVRWLEIRQSADEGAFRRFLERFSSGAFRSKAVAKLDSIVWTKTLVDPTLERLGRYLAEFANGMYRHEAISRVHALQEPVAPSSTDRHRVGGLAEAIRERTSADDLKRIRGIGVLTEKRLNALGTTTYRHIADWTPEDVDRISKALDFKGRIQRENWVEQARILSAGGDTEFSRRLDRQSGDASRPKP